MPVRFKMPAHQLDRGSTQSTRNGHSPDRPPGIKTNIPKPNKNTGSVLFFYLVQETLDAHLGVLLELFGQNL